jgi:hypothetical protein
MTYRNEFAPDFWPTDAEVAQLEAAGFVDASWHNNIAPSWFLSFSPEGVHESDYRVEIYVDAINPAYRENEGSPRFTVVGYQDGCPEPISGNPEDFDTGATFDNLADAIEAATIYAADCFHTLNR